MKKYLPILMIALLAFSCKKEYTGDGGSTTDPLIGNWVLDEIEFSGSTELAGTPINFTGEGDSLVGGYELRADGTMDYDTKYNLVVNLAPLPSMTIPVDQSGSGTWKKEGNVLVIIDQNGTTRYPIKVVTENILILEQDTVFSQGAIMADMNIEITLKK